MTNKQYSSYTKEGTLPFGFRYKVDSNKLYELNDKLRVIASMPINDFVITIDAHSSATIEGARTTVIALQEALVKDKVTKDELMCINAIKACKQLQDINTLNEETIVSIWKDIVNGCCDNTSAGFDGYRNSMVYVGSIDKIIHVPSSPERIQDEMNLIFSLTTGNKILDSILLHFYLVHIHPFCDGNGRLARLLSLWKLGCINLPISKSINLNLSSYYKVIKDSQDNKDITPFINYMLDMYNNSVYLYSLLKNKLSPSESLLLSKIDKKGRGCISASKAQMILGVGIDDTIKILRDLEIKGYLEYTTDGWRLLWR